MLHVWSEHGAKCGATGSLLGAVTWTDNMTSRNSCGHTLVGVWQSCGSQGVMDLSGMWRHGRMVLDGLHQVHLCTHAWHRSHWGSGAVQSAQQQ